MNTTISISNEIRNKIKEFGNKGETYDEILSRIMINAEERQLQDLLMDTKGTVTIDEAIKSAKKRWHK